ncbi:nucleotidyltransferase family protein [Flexistipes sp.]|uniref:nucleotidyltransferase family protein n=1 Tax=Flexistipes sp. TaxID=3088135 RepID=UPI002E1B361B|nr:nucleotidyltransferase family protein [Flexistipes sp.]
MPAAKNELTKEQILQYLREHKKELYEKYGVRKIGLFGSYARNENKKSSDIDIVVELESDNKFRSFFELKYYLEESLDMEVDLGIESAVKKEVRNQINRDIIYV